MKRLIGEKIKYEDDIVVVYDDKDKIVYKDLFDYCPYKDDIYDSPYEDGFYRLPQNYKATKANNIKKLMKFAWKEIDVLSFSPEYLADKILKLWNQIDGPLQNTFEAFTLRYDNKLKQEIANILNKQGYEVYPILLVDCPMYASKNDIQIKGNNEISRHLKSDLEYIKNKRGFNVKAKRLIDFYKSAFPDIEI